MAPSVFGVDVAGMLGGTVGASASDATFHRATSLGPTPGAATSGTNVVFDDFPCKGYVRAFDDGEIDEDRILVTDRKIGIYASTLLDDAGDAIVPKAGDRVTIAEEGLEPQSFSVVGVLRGTAAARYVLHGRA